MYEVHSQTSLDDFGAKVKFYKLLNNRKMSKVIFSVRVMIHVKSESLNAGYYQDLFYIM